MTLVEDSHWLKYLAGKCDVWPDAVVDGFLGSGGLCDVCTICGGTGIIASAMGATAEDLICPCSKHFRRDAAYERHMRAAHGSFKIHKCQTCNKILSSAKALQAHNESVHRSSKSKPRLATNAGDVNKSPAGSTRRTTRRSVERTPKDVSKEKTPDVVPKENEAQSSSKKRATRSTRALDLDTNSPISTQEDDVFENSFTDKHDSDPEISFRDPSIVYDGAASETETDFLTQTAADDMDDDDDKPGKDIGLFTSDVETEDLEEDESTDLSVPDVEPAKLTPEPVVVEVSKNPLEDEIDDSVDSNTVMLTASVVVVSDTNQAEKEVITEEGHEQKDYEDEGNDQTASLHSTDPKALDKVEQLTINQESDFASLVPQEIEATEAEVTINSPASVGEEYDVVDSGSIDSQSMSSPQGENVAESGSEKSPHQAVDATDEEEIVLDVLALEQALQCTTATRVVSTNTMTTTAASTEGLNFDAQIGSEHIVVMANENDVVMEEEIISEYIPNDIDNFIVSTLCGISSQNDMNVASGYERCGYEKCDPSSTVKANGAYNTHIRTISPRRNDQEKLAAKGHVLTYGGLDSSSGVKKSLRVKKIIDFRAMAEPPMIFEDQYIKRRQSPTKQRKRSRSESRSEEPRSPVKSPEHLPEVKIVLTDVTKTHPEAMPASDDGEGSDIIPSTDVRDDNSSPDETSSICQNLDPKEEVKEVQSPESFGFEDDLQEAKSPAPVTSTSRSSRSRDAPSFPCTACGREFANEKYLAMHMSLHQVNNVSEAENVTVKVEAVQDIEPVSITQPVDGIHPVVVTKEDVANYMVRSSTGWNCKICGKKFASNSNVVNHLRTHSDERPYVCNICSIGFKEKYHLQKHIRFRHSSERPCKCQFCGKRFKDSTAVRAHERIHSSDRPFQCKKCGKTFKTTECLWHHEHRSKSCGLTSGRTVTADYDEEAGQFEAAAAAAVLLNFEQGAVHNIPVATSVAFPSPQAAIAIHTQESDVKPRRKRQNSTLSDGRTKRKKKKVPTATLR